jgi:hypothetical protein
MENITTLFSKSHQVEQVILYILMSWSVLNILLGIELFKNKKDAKYYFIQLCVGWNIVNLAIALIGLYALNPVFENANEAFQSILNTHYIFLGNAGLDIGYMVFGLYLIEKSKNYTEEVKRLRIKSFGKAMILQGLFLFLLDAVAFGWLLVVFRST